MKKSNQIHQLLRVFFFLKLWFTPTLFTNTLTHTKQQKRVKYTHVHEWHAPTHSHQRSHAFWAIYNVATSERQNCVKRCSRILSKDKFYDTTMDHWSGVTHLALIASSGIAVSKNSGTSGSACSNDPLDMFFVFESYILYIYFAHTETLTLKHVQTTLTQQWKSKFDGESERWIFICLSAPLTHTQNNAIPIYFLHLFLFSFLLHSNPFAIFTIVAPLF